MRASQLRGALLCTRRYLRVAASACALGLLLNACGGNDSADTSNNTSLPVTVSGADGASVSLRALPRATKNQATVRVARDGTGAPLLGDGYTPLGAVYQFTPLGWIEEAIEIRVPFAASETATPRLLIAQPGGHWMEVAGARRQGNFMVARVPQLAYATVVASTADTTPSGRLRALAAHIAGTETTEPLQLSFDEQTTTPALPLPDANLDVIVTSNTSLGLKLQYDLPTGCSVSPVVSIYTAGQLPGTQEDALLQLSRSEVPSNTGTLSYTIPISASDNGFKWFLSIAECYEPGISAPRFLLGGGIAFFVMIPGDPSAPLPSITSAPQDANVVDGGTASFSVTVEGDALSYEYEWQRSNDGGVTYTYVDADDAPSYSLAASPSDNNAFFRVRVFNANGFTTSTPAKLTVTAHVIAPTVTSDPANQTVIEGETASFSVSGSGQPAPTVQWQQRAVANADPEAGWADIAGATNTTYTTSATTLSQSGAQYRALLRNAGGVAATLPATLVVNAQIIAPTIVTAPQSLSVTAGQFGLFSVTASGSTPLSYQWLKNGQAITGANASEVLVLADPADAGSSYQITVQVSNSASTVTSPVATLSVSAAGTTVSAADGGTVASTDGSSLSIPPGALSSDTTVSVTNEAVDPALLPADVLGLSDAIEIRPAGLQFGSPVTLTFKVSTQIPAGMTIAIVDVGPSTGILSARPGAAIQSATTGNLRRSAASGVKVLATKASVGNVFIPSSLQCGNVQNISTDGAYQLSGIASAIRKMAVAVPLSRCSSVEPIAPTEVPRDTDQPCNDSSQFADANSDAGLINRHVQCVSAIATNQDISVDLELVSTNPDTQVSSWRLITNGKAFAGPSSSPPRQNSCRLHRSTSGAAMKDGLGSNGQTFKDRAVARLLPPESAAIDVVAREVGIGTDTLERWREDARSRPARGRAWTAAGRLEAVVTTAAMNEADKGAWCRSHGVYPQELAKWRASATTALAAPEELRASPQATRQDRKRIKELERELLRKDRALAETAALLVLSKKVQAIFSKGEDE